jgi:hypothetical protein
MHRIFPPSSTLRIAIVADVDIPIVNKFAEQFIPYDPQFDMIVLCGPLTHRECKSAEDLAVIKANISAIIAQLESVVCRVAYLASDLDPTDVLTEQLNLTPNSVNIHARCLPLDNGLFACGFAETRGNLQSGQSLFNADDEDELCEGVEVSSSLSSVQIISELLDELHACGGQSDISDFVEAEGATPEKNHPDQNILTKPRTDVMASSSNSRSNLCVPLGLFALSYKFSFTLNHFLFHIPEQLSKAGVKVAIIAPPCGEVQALHKPKLPTSFGGLQHIVDCGSLRDDGRYAVLTLSKEDSSDGSWSVVNVEQCSL